MSSDPKNEPQSPDELSDENLEPVAGGCFEPVISDPWPTIPFPMPRGSGPNIPDPFPVPRWEVE